MEKLGLWLKEKRLERGLTQEKLSEKSGLSQSSISLLENGEVNNTTYITIIGLIGALQLSQEELWQLFHLEDYFNDRIDPELP